MKLKILVVLVSMVATSTVMAMNQRDPNLAPKSQVECSKRSAVKRTQESNQKVAKNDVTKSGKIKAIK